MGTNPIIRTLEIGLVAGFLHPHHSRTFNFGGQIMLPAPVKYNVSKALPTAPGKP